MSNHDQKEDYQGFTCPYSAGADFEAALSQARSHFVNGDIDLALDLLVNLERKYVRASKLFDLLGDVLLKRGDVKEGIRYKTLHEILKGTFKIARQEAKALSAVTPMLFDPKRMQPTAGGGETTTTKRSDPAASFRDIQSRFEEADVDFPDSDELFPVTAAMGHEFMRQGHYDRALDIFELLLERDPDDESLKQARDHAGEKHRKVRLLKILQGWLQNIETMKTPD
jgi:tetratricopeptide (TPR) repeat protein